MNPAEAAAILLAAGYEVVTSERLYDPSEYLCANAGDAEACLDAYYTSAKLRAIAEWMDRPAEVAAEYARLQAKV